MMRVLLKSKLHRVKVTHTELHYEGSCAIDSDLLEAANLCEYERVEIYNVNNGQRFSTYIVVAPRGSRMVRVMGAAARLASPDDHLIVAAYASFDAAEARGFKPHIVLVDEENRIVRQRDLSMRQPSAKPARFSSSTR
jgi:aspartate 1-decarboxylase